jgi:integrase
MISSDPKSMTMGAARFSLMCPSHVRKCRDRRVNKPESANALVKALRQVFKWAVDVGLANSNPAKDVPYLRGDGQGFHAWTIEEVHQFEQRHPIGTKARLALALLLLTGQRRSDVVLFGKQHIRDSKNVSPILRNDHSGRWLYFTQQTNRERNSVTLMIPIVPELEEIIANSPCGDLTLLVTAFGKPFTPAGFGNWSASDVMKRVFITVRLMDFVRPGRL